MVLGPPFLQVEDFHDTSFLQNHTNSINQTSRKMFAKLFFITFCLVSGYGFRIQRVLSRQQVSKTSLNKHKSKESPAFLREAGNSTNPSSLFASEVSSFGISTALAEQHIQLGNFEDAKKLAEEAKLIGEHT